MGWYLSTLEEKVYGWHTFGIQEVASSKILVFVLKEGRKLIDGSNVYSMPPFGYLDIVIIFQGISIEISMMEHTEEHRV